MDIIHRKQKYFMCTVQIHNYTAWLVLFIVWIYFQQEHLDVTTVKTAAAPAKVKDDQIVMESQVGQSEH